MPAEPQSWDRLLDAFSGAVELPVGSERDNYILTKLGDDPILLFEVSAMLRAHETAEPLEIEKRLLTPAESDTGLAGKAIGPYRLVSLIARGGMGEVYEAEREKDAGFRQRVALKLLRLGLTDANARLRFQQERQILARLIHPLIVPLLDGGVTADGRPYLVLQHVEGEPITAYCEKRQCDIEERLRLLRDVARAVEHAHRNLIVHRDLKPSNILVTTDGQVRLLDFGVSKMLDSSADDPAPLTGVETRVMTIDYAAPEQVRGEAITTATDVYGLGVLLYELLVGRRPFPAEGGRMALERRILNEEPELPSKAAASIPGGRAARLRGDLDTIVSKAMAKDPGRRYPSAGEFAQDIERHLAGEPVLARKPSSLYRLGKLVRRNRLAAMATATSVILLLGLTGVTFFQSRRVARERDLARIEQERANKVVALLVDLFNTANPENMPGGSDITVGEFLKRVDGTVAAGQRIDPAVHAQLRSTLGKVYLARSQYALARPHLEAALEGLRRLYGERHAATAAALHDLAHLDVRTGSAAEALPLARAALQLNRELYGESHESVAECMQDLARVTDHREQRLELLEGALAMRRRLSTGSSLSVAENLSALGNFHYGYSDMDRALRYFEETYAMLQQVVPKGHPALLSAMGDIAAVYQHGLRFAEAERIEREVLEEKRRVLGDESFEVGIAWGNLGTLLTQEGKYAEAERAFYIALLVLRKSSRPGDVQVSSAMRNLGIIRLLRGAPHDGARLLHDAVESFPRGSDASGYWFMVCQEATAKAYAGRVSEAASQLRLAVQKLSEDPGAWLANQRLTDARVYLAFVLLETGDAKEAEGHFRAAVEARRQRKPAVDEGALAAAQCGLGAALARQGKAEGTELLHRHLPAFKAWALANPYHLAIVTRRQRAE